MMNLKRVLALTMVLMLVLSSAAFAANGELNGSWKAKSSVVKIGTYKVDSIVLKFEDGRLNITAKYKGKAVPKINRQSIGYTIAGGKITTTGSMSLSNGMTFANKFASYTLKAATKSKPQKLTLTAGALGLSVSQEFYRLQPKVSSVSYKKVKAGNETKLKVKTQYSNFVIAYDETGKELGRSAVAQEPTSSYTVPVTLDENTKVTIVSGIKNIANEFDATYDISKAKTVTVKVK